MFAGIQIFIQYEKSQSRKSLNKHFQKIQTSINKILINRQKEKYARKRGENRNGHLEIPKIA